MNVLTSPRFTRRLFYWGAWGYGLSTDQATWKARCAELVRHFPPTAEPPRVLDLGCGPGAHAVTARETGQDALLAFTSLVKAVAFMQPAVIAGLTRDVNKVGKFRRETVET